MVQPAVSVVLPTYNRGFSALRAAMSVLAQDFHDLELIVVDDGSKDNTIQILETLNDSRMRIIRAGRNAGQSTARNIGVQAASAKLIAFQDSDDVWHQSKLTIQLQALAENEKAAIIYSDMRRIRTDGTWFELRAPDIAEGQLFDDRPSVYRPAGIGIQSCLIRSEVLRLPAAFCQK